MMDGGDAISIYINGDGWTPCMCLKSDYRHLALVGDHILLKLASIHGSSPLSLYLLGPHYPIDLLQFHNIVL